MSYEVRVMSYELWSSGYKLQGMSDEIWGKIGEWGGRPTKKIDPGDESLRFRGRIGNVLFLVWKKYFNANTETC